MEMQIPREKCLEFRVTQAGSFLRICNVIEPVLGGRAKDIRPAANSWDVAGGMRGPPAHSKSNGLVV
ncbi:MAG: hypothetical protein COB90_09285 [Hyphomicrobiales bacterium]|nr:MAG: hypothetical protein COB90_09285 [Hyphomicrobiales bacterium]